MLYAAYLGAYGPATPEEFARWFDLKPALARTSFARLDAAGTLAHVDVDGAPGVIPEEQLDALTTPRPTGDVTVLLLPAFDPYIVGSTRQLDHIGAAGHKADVSRPQGWISATLVVDCWIRGVWAADDSGSPVVTAFGTLPPQVRRHLTTSPRPQPRDLG